MKTIKSLSLILALSTTLASADSVLFDAKNPIVTHVSIPDSERKSKDYPIEYIDTERGFDPSVMPVDVNLKFTFAGEDTEAEIVVSGAIQTNDAGKLNKIWVTAPSLSKVFKVQLKKGINTISLTKLPIRTAAENFIDKRKKGQNGTAIGLTFKILVKNNEVGSKQISYPAHLLYN